MGLFNSWKERLYKINSDLEESEKTAADFWIKNLNICLEEAFKENNLPNINLNCYCSEATGYGAFILDDADEDVIVAEIEFGTQDDYYAFQVTNMESEVTNVYNLKNYPNDYPKPFGLVKDMLKDLGFGNL